MTTTPIALRTLPGGRTALVRREPDGWALECGDLRQAFGCALEALHALGVWGGETMQSTEAAP